MSTETHITTKLTLNKISVSCLTFTVSTKLFAFVFGFFHTWLESAVYSKLGLGAGFLNYTCLTRVNFK